jgi:hypothetical protein
VIAGFGNVRLILVARHRIGVRQAALRRSRLAARRPVTTEDRRVALAGGRLYHRPTCRMVAGKQAAAVAAEHTLAPCGWCRP